jgi:coatomer protein complex subunit alpha (xenin)
VPSLWVVNSSLAGDHAAAGSFETAMQLLNRQIGIVNFAPLRGAFMQAYLGARVAVPTLPHLPPLTVHASRTEADQPPPREATLPPSVVSLALLQQRLQHVYACFTDGKFSETAATCDQLFALLPLCVVSRREDVAEVKAVLKACCEYKLAVRVMQTARTTDQEDKARQMELAAYMTHCALEPAHLLLALNSAMRTAFKHQNYITAAGFARRLLELPEANSAKNAKLLGDAKKVLTLSEQQARNAVKVDYDDRTPFSLCAGSLAPLYRGAEVVRSPYCGATYAASFKGSVCVIDGLSVVGTETLGLVCSAVQTRAK